MKDIDFLKKGIFAYQGIYDNKNVYENTLEAFKVAIKRRNNIYFEVIETKDHKFVVCKNDVFERIHNSKDKVEDMTYDELCYVSFYHIPLLEEVLELINGIVGIMIDPKVHTKHKNLFELLDNYNGKFAIISVNPKIINWFNKNRPEYVVGEVITKRKGFNLSFYFNKTDFKSYNIDYFDKIKVSNLRDLGDVVIGYLINSTEKYETYKNVFDNLIADNFLNLKINK